jgi:hypothetical protein
VSVGTLRPANILLKGKIALIVKKGEDHCVRWLYFHYVQWLFHFKSIKTGPYYWFKLWYASSQTISLVSGLHMLSGLTGQVLEHCKKHQWCQILLTLLLTK